MEIIKIGNINGHRFSLWQDKDAEGRVVYAATRDSSNGGRRISMQPASCNIHSQKTALALFRADYPKKGD